MADDPLAALEELLKKQQGGKAGSGQADPDAQKKAEEATAAEKAREEAEYQAKVAAQQEADALALQEHLEKFNQVAQMPEEQARVEQASALHKTETVDDGFQIKQLGHTKV